MLDEIKTCVTARTEFFAQYYEVPESVKPELDAFVEETNLLGENCESAQDFEEKFVSSGLSTRFTELLSKCTPKAFEMTAEQKAESKQIRKEMYSGKQMMQDAVKDVADSAFVEIEEEAIAQNRKRMIDEGTYDEYTKVSNQIDNVNIFSKFIGNLFRKK
jgi:hypothetical protein